MRINIFSCPSIVGVFLSLITVSYYYYSNRVMDKKSEFAIESRV